MRKRTPQLEWQIVENDEEWERQQAQRAADVAPLIGPRRTIQEYAGNVIALLLLLMMVGAWWRTSQAGNQQKGVSVYRPGQIAPAFDTQQQIIVPSPAFYLAPVKVTNADLLAQSIALPLIHLVLTQAQEHYGIKVSLKLTDATI